MRALAFAMVLVAMVLVSFVVVDQFGQLFCGQSGCQKIEQFRVFPKRILESPRDYLACRRRRGTSLQLRENGLHDGQDRIGLGRVMIPTMTYCGSWAIAAKICGTCGTWPRDRR